MAKANDATTHVPASIDKTLHALHVHLGIALQRQRLRRGLTQVQLAGVANLSPKYLGEIERGEANTTLETIARLADAIGWNPMDALEGAREPLTEGVRLMLIQEAEHMRERLDTIVKWLRAINPDLDAGPVRPSQPVPTRKLQPSRARPSRPLGP